MKLKLEGKIEMPITILELILKGAMEKTSLSIPHDKTEGWSDCHFVVEDHGRDGVSGDGFVAGTLNPEERGGICRVRFEFTGSGLLEKNVPLHYKISKMETVKS